MRIYNTEGNLVDTDAIAKIDHGGLAGLTDDDHGQYIKDTEFTQDSGVLVGTGAGTFAEETGATLRTSLGLAIGTDVLAEQTIGIADDNLVEMDDAGPANAGEYCVLTANGVAGATKTDMLTFLNVADGADVTGSNAPQAHASTHDSGGSDQVHSIADNDDNTKVQVEESADENIIRMDVAGTEVFHLSAIGELTLAKQSTCRAYLGSAQGSISTITYTKINLDTETFDTQNEFNTGTYKFTATEAGKYLVAASVVMISMGADKRVWTVLYKNGVSWMEVGAGTPVVSSFGPLVLDEMILAANDYIELYVFHDHGSDRSADGGSAKSFLAIAKIS